jgi:hypothetical protein
MAGLLRALVAEGVGAAVVWGLVPAFRPVAALHVPQRMMGSLLSAKADLVRAYLASAFRDHAELIAAAGTAAVTVSASLLLTLSAPRTHERPERVPVPAPAVERAPQHPVAAVSPTTQLPVAAVSPTTRTPGHGPSRNEGAPGDRWGPNRGGSSDQGLHDDQGEDQDDQGEAQDNNDQGEAQDNNDQGKDEGNDDQGKDQDNNDQGKGEGNDDQGEN